MKRSELLNCALEAVDKRPKSYGPPEQNFERIADLWGVYMAARADAPQQFDATDIAILMILMKVARLIETPGHIDSWTDIAGYAACGAEVSTTSRNTCEIVTAK